MSIYLSFVECPAISLPEIKYTLYSPAKMAELSHAIDLFMHSDRTSFFDDDSIAAGVIAPLDPRPALEPDSFSWDLPTTCRPMLPAFQYISHKLHERELSVALIISEHEPFVIPVWPLARKAQLILSKIVRKACARFDLSPSWLTALAAHSNKRDFSRIFDQYRPDSYIVRRSIVQHEVVFSEEGLTLLNIDHIYTFKQLLCTLSKKDWVPHARDVCLSSCVHLLHRINEVYTDPKVSRGYIARVYKDIEFNRGSWEEVNSAYSLNYCSASIKDVTMLEPDYTALTDITLDWERDSSDREATELADTSTPRQGSSTEDLISPIATVDLSTLNSWEEKPLLENDIISPLTLKYPGIRPPSSVPESPLEYRTPWSPVIPRPLNTSDTRKSYSPMSPLSEDDANADAWDEAVPGALDILDSWDDDVPASLKNVNSRGSDPLQSPFEYVKQWVESWSTSSPEQVCANCHDIMPMARRFTVV